jgi:predicted nucleic acid-binding protein
LKPVAVLDANVLYDSTLRDLFMRLATSDTYRAHWTPRIQHEWTHHLTLNRPDLPSTALQRTVTLMNAALKDAMLEPPPSMDLSLPDPDDHHVLEAAIACGATHIVTSNIRDFPGDHLDPHGVEAVTPDEFILYCLEIDPQQVLATMDQQRRALKNPPYTLDGYLNLLERHGLPRTVARIRQEHP